VVQLAQEPVGRLRGEIAFEGVTFNYSTGRNAVLEDFWLTIPAGEALAGGLEIVGLAFEMTENVQRNRRVLKRFAERHGVDYRLLLAGTATDKNKATEALGTLDQVLSYPTTVLIDRSGKVSFIHTGFSGPSTGRHYDELVKRYRRQIEALL